MSFIKQLNQRLQQHFIDAEQRAIDRRQQRAIPPAPQRPAVVEQLLKTAKPIVDPFKNLHTKDTQKTPIRETRRGLQPRQFTEREREIGRSVVDFGKAVLRDMPRSIAQLELKRAGKEEFKPETRIQRFVFGEEPIKIPEKTGADMLRGFGAEEKTAEQWGGAVGYPLAVLGAIPIIGTKKKLARQIAKEGKEEAVKRTLKQGIRGVTDRDATILARELTPVKDAKIVQQRLDDFVRARQQARAVTPTAQAITHPTPLQTIRDKAKEVVKAEKLTPERNHYLRTKNWAAKSMTGFKERVVNDWERVRQIANDPNLPVPEGHLTPAEKRKLYFGRMSSRIEQAENEAKTVLTDIINTSKTMGVSDDVLRKDVHEYLIARHAPERNIALGKPRAAGISNEEAAAIIQRIEISPNAEPVKRIAQNIRSIDDRVLDILYQEGRAEGVIDTELYNLLKKRYQNHIPLHRILPENEGEDIVQLLSGRGLDVRGPGIMRAKGSELPVSDVIENTFANLTQAIQRVEKNIVDNETLRFARQFNKAYPDLKLFEEIKPKAIGKTFDGKRTITEQIKDATVLSMREHGKQIYLRINDPKLAVAFKGVNREILPSYMRFAGSFTRFLGSLLTRYNPVFVLSNKIRDIQESVIYLASQKESGAKTAVKAIAKESQSFNDIADWIRGKNTLGAKLYEQMRLDGGTTGGLALSTKEQLVRSLENIEEEIKAGHIKKGARRLVEGIDKWNQLFEDSTRLSTYRAMLEKGVTRNKAALMAKDVTIDFNQLGTAGPVINALYMFSNASIQGSYKMIKAMRNPKVAAAVTTTIGASVFATNQWNDNIDPGWRERVSRWDRANSLNIVIPSVAEEKFVYVSIPVSWGLKPMKVAMDYANDLATGHIDDIPGALEGIIAAAITGYNPLGEQSLIGAITPTLLDIPSQIARNEAWFGGRIKPVARQHEAQADLYFSSLEETLLGRGLISATDRAYETTDGRIDVSPADINYAINQYIGGAGRFASQTFNLIAAIGKDEVPPVREIPFVSRFLRVKDIEETGAGGEKAEDIRKILELQSRARKAQQRDVRRTYEEIINLPTKEERKQAWVEINAENPEFAKRLDDFANERALGLTVDERLIKNLGVENQERARYIYSHIKSLPTREQRQELWLDWVNKKIITERVERQIQELSKNKL